VCYDRRMPASFRACLALACLVACSGASAVSAENLPSTTYLDRADGYEITIPTAWKLVPRSKAELTAEIASLRRTKSAANAELASTYASILASPAGVTGLTSYRFQAFAWPVDGSTPLLTEVSVGLVGDSKAYGHANLTTVGDQYANALSANAGSKILDPRRVRLPAGNAEFVEGTIPAGSGLATGVELYLIPHGKHVYELAFSVDATFLSQATLFAAIAEHFRFL
jgi:hypothetical protein